MREHVAEFTYTIELTEGEVEEHFPTLALAKRVARRVEDACAALGIVGDDLQEQAEKRINEAIHARELAAPPPVLHTADAPTLPAPEEVPPEAQMLRLFETAYNTYAPTHGPGGEGNNRRWLTVNEVVDLLDWHESTARKYLDILVRLGALRTKLDKHRPGRRGRRPRLYSFNPDYAEEE